MPRSDKASPPPLRLGVNIDHVATVRNARGGFYPDPHWTGARARSSAIPQGASRSSGFQAPGARHGSWRPRSGRPDGLDRAVRRSCAEASTSGRRPNPRADPPGGHQACRAEPSPLCDRLRVRLGRGLNGRPLPHCCGQGRALSRARRPVSPPSKNRSSPVGSKGLAPGRTREPALVPPWRSSASFHW